ncbi:MAG: ATP-binding protein [Chthoniobacterales bacterium]|nr:ATP-binding protein [Chthoniobacterales bacterium]
MLFDLPIFSFDLSCMENEEFVYAWQDALQRTPCIVLIEDIDNVFHGRQNVTNKSTLRDPLTFDCLLNAISGVGMNDGVFTIITTNCKDKLDPALGVPDTYGNSSRPGRIDRAFYLGVMEEPERLKLADHILSDWPDLAAPAVAAGEGMTPAQFQNHCAQIALRKFWGRGTM